MDIPGVRLVGRNWPTDERWEDDRKRQRKKIERSTIRRER